MRKIIIAAIFMGVAGTCRTAYAETMGAGTRIDYFNAKGERFSSSYAETGGLLYFDVRNNPEDGFVVSNSYLMGEDTYIGSMKFVPWGVESYPVNIVNESPGNIEISYEVVTDNNERSQNTPEYESRGSSDILCGSDVRLTIRVPEGTYPIVSTGYEYTARDVYGEQQWNTYESLGISELSNWNSLYRHQLQATDMNARVDKKVRLSGTGAFVRNQNDKNVWTIDLTMPNESMSVKVSYRRPDSELLRQSVLMALCELYTQFEDISFNQDNGEPWVMNYFGEGLSQDYVSEYYHRTLPELPMEVLLSSNNLVSSTPWANAFAAITHANSLLDNIDCYIDATVQEKELARAQMLALRSHSYFRLLQIYGGRWADSNNGSMLCAPLETSFNTESLPLSSMREIADRCYADLDEAMEIFGRNDFKREHVIQPNMNVARGIKMRVAMLREDWFAARELAERILAESPLTTNDELRAGFFTDIPSWIWGAYNDMWISYDCNNYLYYWSTQCYYACNGIFAANWRIGSGGIDKDLYLSISEEDLRRSLFAMPDQLMVGTAEIRQYDKWSTWYDSGKVDSSTLFASQGGDTWAISELFSNIYEERRPAGVDYPAFKCGGSYVPVQFGAQVKFYSPTNYYGTAATLFMRTEEALLCLAESCFRLGDEATAREWIEKLNSMRCEGYTCTLSGDALLKEIQNTRKIELWGEGHSWFDHKRWNMPISRRVWVDSDETSGNWFSNVPSDIPVDYANGWRCPVPAYYVKQNPLVDVGSLDYTGVTGYEVSQQLPALVKEGTGSQPRYNNHTDITLRESPMTFDLN